MIITNVFFTSDVECIPGEQVKIRAGVNSTVRPFTQWEKSNKGFFFFSFLFFPLHCCQTKESSYGENYTFREKYQITRENHLDSEK